MAGRLVDILSAPQNRFAPVISRGQSHASTLLTVGQPTGEGGFVNLVVRLVVFLRAISALLLPETRLANKAADTLTGFLEAGFASCRLFPCLHLAANRRKCSVLIARPAQNGDIHVHLDQTDKIAA